MVALPFARCCPSLGPLPWSPAARAITAALSGTLFTIGLSACVTAKPPPSVVAGSHVSPAISLSTSTSGAGAGARHVIVIDCPTPGWTPTLDQIRPAFRSNQAYVTLREPNPAFIYPQVMTSVRIGTSVPTDQTLEVFARVLTFGTIVDDETGVYRAVKLEPAPQR